MLRDLANQPMKRVVLRSRVMAPYQRRRFHHFGDGAIVHKPAWVYGPQQMSIGAHSLVMHGTSLSVESPAWDKAAPTLSIGKRVGIRPYCMISATERIEIEDDVIIAAFSSVIDSDHTFDLGRPNVMHNPMATAPIRIGRGTWIAERVAVLRGANIGRCCIIGANSVVKGEIPDYSIAVGAPARVVGTVDGVDADQAPVTERLF
jgi:carbonic anhydrase/acetyltransferase-like protein (isoleucine patch superfamily)